MMRIMLCLITAVALSNAFGCGGLDVDCTDEGCVEQVAQPLEVNPVANHGGGCKGGGGSDKLKQLVPEIDFDVDDQNTVELDMIRKLCMGYPGLSALCNSQPGTFKVAKPKPPTTGQPTDPTDSDPADPGTTANE